MSIASPNVGGLDGSAGSRFRSATRAPRLDYPALDIALRWFVVLF